jgi:hypothetical protein
MADFELSESCSRILQESKSIPNPFQNQSKLRTGELRKGLDSWLENMEAEAIASRPLTLALILDMAGKLESIATFLQLHPCSDRKRTADHTKIPPLFLFLISRFCSANARPCSSLNFKLPSSGSGSPGRVTRRVCFGVFARTRHRVYKPESRFCFLN